MRARFPIRILLLVLIGLNFVITVYGIAALSRSPYTGLRFESKENAAFVARVDRGSPAFESVQPGDQLIELEGLGISPYALKKDPDDIGTRTGQRRFWEAVKMLDEAVERGRPVELTILRDGAPVRVSILPGPFPMLKVLSRIWPVSLAGWLYLLIGYLVFRKKPYDIARANLVLSFFICVNFITMSMFVSRDLAFSYQDFRMLYTLNAVACLTFSAAFLHLMLVFPARKKILGRYPRLIYAPYAAAFGKGHGNITDEIMTNLAKSKGH